MPRRLGQAAAVKLFVRTALVPAQRLSALLWRYSPQRARAKFSTALPPRQGVLPLRQPGSPSGSWRHHPQAGPRGEGAAWRQWRGQHGPRRRGHGAQGVGEGRTGRARGRPLPSRGPLPRLCLSGTVREKCRQLSQPCREGLALPRFLRTSAAASGMDATPRVLASSRSLASAWPAALRPSDRSAGAGWGDRPSAVLGKCYVSPFTVAAVWRGPSWF